MFLPVKEEKKYFQTFEQVNQTEEKTNYVQGQPLGIDTK